MSEYWVAHKKYFCKYCNIYIADDAPSKRQHENGLRHKGNVERFVRGLYKAGEKRKQDLEEEKREMARIEKAAGAAFAQDVGAGLAKASTSSSAVAGPSSSAKQPAAPKPSNPYANYSTAESLGYTDPDAERARAEAELRRMEGVAGEWEILEVVPSSSAQDGEGEGEGGEQKSGEGARTGEKRPAEAEVPVDDDDGRAWKLRRKTASVGLGELYDPGALPIKLKPKKEEVVQESGLDAGTSGVSERPKWSARGWNKPGASSSSIEKADIAHESGEGTDGLKAEESSVLDKLVDELVPEASSHEVKAEVKAEIAEPAAPPPPTGSMFKKRKAPVGGGNRGGRRI